MVLVPPLHRHQTPERRLGIPEHHIIVDRKEWLSAMEKLRLIEDEVRDAMEICGCGLANELCCWDELSDEALVEFERLIRKSGPCPSEFASKYTFLDKIRYWTFDDWKDWLMKLCD